MSSNFLEPWKPFIFGVILRLLDINMSEITNIRMYHLIKSEIPSDAIDLPPPYTKRWVTRRKAVVVNAVRGGVISLEEVCRRYELSVDEFLAWQRAIETHGVPGLRVTRLQIYRDNPPSRVAKPPC